LNALHANSLTIALALLAGVALAAEPAPASPAAVPKSECKTVSRSTAVVVVLCPKGLAKDAWTAAGQAACGSVMACNAWIWDDAATAPKVAPARDADFDKRATGKAVAVWANDSKSLLVVSKPAKVTT
jgi:hypothetical protein